MSRKNPIHNGILISDLDANGHKIKNLEIEVSDAQIKEAIKPELEDLDSRVTSLEEDSGGDVIVAEKFETTNGTIFDDDGIYNGNENRGVVFNSDGSVVISNGGTDAIIDGNTYGPLATQEYVEQKLSESGGGVAELMTPITHADLLTLRNNSQLVPGMQYRITDYVATTKQENTKSANHPFDIIVTADDENTLNEVARAIRHEGDTYFANCKLEAWKIWYCLDNDENRFAWATSSETIDGVAVAGKGVIYRMIDEWDNDVPYDFKGIMMKAYFGDEGWSDDYRYTFGGASDETIKTEPSCYANKMGEFVVYGGRRTINHNIFGSDCFNNIFGSECGYNTFDQSCYCNTFDRGCYYNIFGSECGYNTFDQSCYCNTFDQSCYYNIFGSGCSNNNFSMCRDNVFGSDCNNNTFGSGCNNNTFGSGCDNNAFYYACDNNWFGSACNNNWFGSDCNNNTFGSACNNNVFGIEEYWTLDNYQYITFGSGCSGIVLHCTETTGYSQPYKNVEIKSGVTGEFDSFGVLLSYKTITDNNVNQSFHTTYKPVGSMEISV